VSEEDSVSAECIWMCQHAYFWSTRDLSLQNFHSAC